MIRAMTVFANLLLTIWVCVASSAAVPDDFSRLRERFVSPPREAGTVTLYWLNGKITKEGIREQMRALRDQCGFGGVAPLTFYSMEPPTKPAYLSGEYFDVYGCILDTAKELGMTVVFYDDCDFPSGSAGDQVREKFPNSLMKYLARGRATVTDPGEAVLTVPDGVLMSVVAKNLDDGTRRVVTSDASWDAPVLPWTGTSVGVRQPPVETAIFEYLRVLDSAGKTLFEERFDKTKKLDKGWTNPGAATLEAGGLRANDCLPTWRKGLALPDEFTLEARVTIVDGAAGLAFGVRGADDFYFWQFHAGLGAIRPHHKLGAQCELLRTIPFAFTTGRAYDIRLVGKGRTITTWIDGRQVAVHELPDARTRTLRWNAPAGRWDVQAFVCAAVPGTRLVDYLDPTAMKQFLTLTYDRFAKRFPQHFGSTIKMTFFDDLNTMGAPDCLLWTPSFREQFQKRFGRSAEPYYPALWEDIGAETAAARVALYSVRNEMFAAGYPGVTEAWCAPRGMKSSGHPSGSYNPDPLQVSGDAMLFYKNQGYPLTDYIHYLDHGIDGFKVPASAANNFDSPILVCEIYGNFHQTLPNDANMLYRAGMEVYARGVNYLLPHGTWWDPAKMAIVPEISWRNPEIGPELPQFNRWAARCETLLRGGRHVADIGLVYPIADIESRYCVSEQRPNWGYRPLPGTDYFEIMRLLTGEIRRDFTLLHPEVLDERCRVDGAELLLDNRENKERFKVLLLPACKTIHLSNLKMVKKFYDAGGKVVATTCLPEQSAEFGHNDDVQRLTQAMFGPTGRGVFVPKPDERSLKQALDGLGLVWDVRVENVPNIPRVSRDGSDPSVNQSATKPEWYEGGNRQFGYIHKVLTGTDFYFFGNSSAQSITADVTLRGRLELEVWNPHNGERTPLKCVYDKLSGTDVTRTHLTLESLRSIFLVAPSLTTRGQ
jgi:hypothetical protein